MKYQQRPVDAVHWLVDGDGDRVGRYSQESTQARSKCTVCGFTMARHGVILTPEGRCAVCPGDWIVEGESQPLSAEEFHEKYMPVEEPDTSAQEALEKRVAVLEERVSSIRAQLLRS